MRLRRRFSDTGRGGAGGAPRARWVVRLEGGRRARLPQSAPKTEFCTWLLSQPPASTRRALGGGRLGLRPAKMMSGLTAPASAGDGKGMARQPGQQPRSASARWRSGQHLRGRRCEEQGVRYRSGRRRPGVRRGDSWPVAQRRKPALVPRPPALVAAGVAEPRGTDARHRGGDKWTRRGVTRRGIVGGRGPAHDASPSTETAGMESSCRRRASPRSRPEQFCTWLGWVGRARAVARAEARPAAGHDRHGRRRATPASAREAVELRAWRRGRGRGRGPSSR